VNFFVTTAINHGSLGQTYVGTDHRQEGQREGEVLPREEDISLIRHGEANLSVPDLSALFFFFVLLLLDTGDAERSRRESNDKDGPAEREELRIRAGREAFQICVISERSQW
jgi:hypothetical protein